VEPFLFSSERYYISRVNVLVMPLNKAG